MQNNTKNLDYTLFYDLLCILFYKIRKIYARKFSYRRIPGKGKNH